MVDPGDGEGGLHTWKHLAHSDSNASFEPDESVVGRVDSVALARRRMSKLGQADDSITVAKRRLQRDEQAGAAAKEDDSAAAAVSGDGGAAAPSEAGVHFAEGDEAPSPAPKSGLKEKVTGFFKGLKKDSDKSDSSAKASPAGRPGLGRTSQVRFSEEPPKEVPS